MIHIGIDNGITGGIGILQDEHPAILLNKPIIVTTGYNKMKKNISRINTKLYKDIFKDFDVKNTIITFERPMINPTRFDSTLSAVRCLEAELICLEELGFGYRFIDSKEWQRKFLPLSAKGKELKKASFNLGIREFPYLEKNIKEVGDADAIFIAKYSKKYL